ncbi:MAG: hypothetical protein HXX17_10900 [Geobacteraceae bacterium]|nr:hypothetical protein [Geobacteraceae bacterium]
MHRNTLLIAALIFSLLISSCSKSSSRPTDLQVGEAVKSLLPANHKIVRITPVEGIPGIIEVVAKIDTQSVVLYLDKSLKYVFSGSLMEIATKKNLTAESQNIQ